MHIDLIDNNLRTMTDIYGVYSHTILSLQEQHEETFCR